MRNRVMYWSLLVAVLFFLQARRTYAEEEEVEHRIHVGITFVGLAAIGGEGVHGNLGGGVFLEVTLIPAWLEVELNVQGLASEGGAVMPIELLFKKPFHVRPWFHPFIGLGPTFVPAFLPQETQVRLGGGGAAVAGAYFWLSRHVGIEVEANYNLLYEDRAEHAGITHEVGGTTGLVLGY